MAAIDAESDATWRASARTPGSSRLTSVTALGSPDSDSWTWIQVSSMPSPNEASDAGSIASSSCSSSRACPRVAPSRPQMLATTTGSPTGLLLAARIVLVLVAGLVGRRLVAADHAAPPTGERAVVTAAALLGAAVTFSASGHAGVDPPVVLGMAADLAHLTAMSVWIGGLVVLFLALHRGGEPTAVAAVLPRFSQTAQVAVAVIVATILAAPFAREADGHLEIALTKPVSRVRFALGTIGADVAGIVAASFITVVAFYLCQMLFESARVDFSGINTRAIAMGIAAPLAWYAMLCAATTWLHRSYGAVLGFAWPVVILIGVLSIIHPSNVVALFIHDVAWVLGHVIPFSYVQFASPDSHNVLIYQAATSRGVFQLKSYCSWSTVRWPSGSGSAWRRNRGNHWNEFYALVGLLAIALLLGSRSQRGTTQREVAAAT